MVKEFPTGDGPEDELPLEKDIEIDGERPDSLLVDDSRDFGKTAKAQRLPRRHALLPVLIPCLLITLLLLGYLDIRNRLGRIQTTGTRKAQVFSENVLDRIKSLSYQYTELDQSVTDKISSLEKSSASIEEELKSFQKEISNLTTSKVDRQDFETAEKERSAELVQTLAGLRKDVTEQTAALEESVAHLSLQLGEARDTLSVLGKDLGEHKNEMTELYHVIETIAKEDEQQEAALSSLSEQKLDKKALDESLTSERERYEAQTALLEKKMKSLEEEIVWLEKQLDIIGPGYGKTAGESLSHEAATIGEASGEAASPLPEKIIEQEITQ